MLSNIIIRLVVFAFLLSVTAASFKEHIDLLELRDNDEFLWGLQENTEQQNSSDFLARHHLNKRQAPNSNELLQENKAYGACRTPLGQSGQCRHIIYCRIPEIKNDIWRLVSQLCVIEQSVIGICCPEGITSRLSPQIAANGNSNNLETARIVNRSEQRGCGVSTKQFTRIQGGGTAELDEWPWMAALMRPELYYVWCGGVLVTDRHVLTAAHCVHKISMTELFVRLGEYNTILSNETRARDFRIGNMVTHIDYDPLTYNNDIAVVRIERPTLYNSYIWPVCMPPLNENWEGRVAVVTGWGTQGLSGPYSNILLEALLPVWNQDACRKANIERIPDTMICAGKPEGGPDSCQGDSGGPLLVQLPNERWVTIGLVSWGLGCGEKMRPGVYTRLDKYLHWIIENSDI